ncbi:putative csep0310 effector protein [Erysiphe necator]|uniref:Putative csep0310 effector protein n=1 Tax=Uncinula necator TaxID=52586 RepID=A0A0B1P7H2_UNCNE|nr:putative csep0310 effector protein [Erysiphe necator]
MSRRGIIPVLIASSIGIINGIWVFKPALSEQQQMISSIDLRKDPVYVSNNDEETSTSSSSLTQKAQDSTTQLHNESPSIWSKIITKWNKK